MNDYSSAAGVAGVGVFLWIIGIAYTVASVIAMWKIFTKAGQAGWKIFIPVYNAMTLFKIIYGSYGKAFMTLIPVFGEILIVASYVRLGQVFGKSVGFRLGLVFLTPIFLLILGFSDAEYTGPVNATL